MFALISDIHSNIEALTAVLEDMDSFAVDEVNRTNIKPIGADQLGEHLRQIFEARTHKILYMKADKGLDFGTIQDAMEIARNAGVRVLAAITEQQQDDAAGGFLLGGR